MTYGVLWLVTLLAASTRAAKVRLSNCTLESAPGSNAITSSCVMYGPDGRAYVPYSDFELMRQQLDEVRAALGLVSPPAPAPSIAFETNSDFACSGKMCKRKTKFQGFFVGVTACSSGTDHYKVRAMPSHTAPP